MPDVILAGDCGGTNTRLVAFEVTPDQHLRLNEFAPGRQICQQEYKNEDFDSFEAILATFFATAGLEGTPPRACCLAVAGPVVKNRVSFMNRDWVIDGNDLEDTVGFEKARLVNDFVANGYGLLTLDESPDSEEVVVLQEAKKVDCGVMACVGAGTGLGECFLTPAGRQYETYPSEGGHADFAPRTAREIELLEFLKDKFEERHRVSVERVVSGKGLANIYEFLASKSPERVVNQEHEEILNAGDNMGGVIAKYAQTEGNLCDEALNILISAYGAEAGVAALKWVPLGGLYLTGGLTPKNIERIAGEDSLFMQAFRDKGRVSPLLSRVPVKAVLAEDLGQRGAHYVAFKLYKTLAHPVAGAPMDRRSSTKGAQFGIMEGECNPAEPTSTLPTVAPAEAAEIAEAAEPEASEDMELQILGRTFSGKEMLRLGLIAALFYTAGVMSRRH